MSRTWVYDGSIITTILIMMATNRVLENMNNYYDVMTCSEVYKDYAVLGIPPEQNPAYLLYPQCASANGTNDGRIAVYADSFNPGR